MALPLLAAYDGGTVIRPPRFLRSWLTDSWLGGAADALLQLFGGAVLPDTMGLVDLGRAYSLYMVLLVVFCTNVLTQRPFPNVSELQLRVDGVGATPRHRGAVDVAVRESTRLVSERRQFRDCICSAQVSRS